MAPTRRPLLHLGGGAALAILALWVRAAWIPLFSRHVFLAHEGDYLLAFQGSWQGGWSTRLVPALGLLYRGLGQLSQAPELLLILALATGLGSIFLLVALCRRHAGPAAGWIAGGLLALHGGHAFWSGSPFHVIHPLSLVLAALVLAGTPSGLATAASGLAFGVGCGMRPELLAALPAVLVLLGSRRLAPLATWLSAAAVPLALSWLPLAAEGAHPVGLLQDAPRALASNLVFLAPLSPWNSAWALLPALALAGVGCWRWRRLGLAMGLLGLCTWLTSCCFADLGSRHALAAAVALCALQALGLVALWETAGQGALRLGVGLLGLLLVGRMLADCADWARRYYADPARLTEELHAAAQGRQADATRLVGCIQVSEETGMPGQRRSSHLELQGTTACLLWQEQLHHLRRTSLGRRDRALRMHTLYRLQALGLHQPPRQEDAMTVLWRLQDRKPWWCSLGLLGCDP